MRKLLRSNDSATLRLARPFGRTLLLTLPVLALLIALLEGIARLPWVESHIPTAIGSAHRDIDFKFGELDYLLRREGRIDCIFVGSSMVRRGINPAVVVQAYHIQTGRDIVCYNFGISGARSSSIAALSEILVKRYHPRLLVYGLSLRELTGEAFDEQRQQNILAAPWIQYQFGSLSMEGWLIEHSTTLRHFLALRDWFSPEFQNPMGDLDSPLHLGYYPLTTHSNMSVPLKYDPVKYAFTFSQWNGLERFIALRSKTQLLLVEMPLPDKAMTAIKGGRASYDQFVGQIANYAAENDVPMWTMADLDLIPPDGWGDTYHLHQSGAEIFSAWLGDQVGQAASQGQLTLKDTH